MPRKGFDDRLKDVKLVLETTKEALTGIGFPGVEPIAGIPLLILRNYEAVGADKVAMSQLLESLESLKYVIYIPIVAKAGGHGTVPEDLFQRVERLKRKLEDLEAMLAPFVVMSSWKRFRERDHITTALADVNRGVAQAIRDFQLESQIAAELEAAEARKRSNLDLLKYAAGSNWNQERTCLAGTRVDLVNELVSAATGVRASPPYRIHLVVGVAGCGKSTLAHSISRTCAELPTPALASTFFFNRGVDQRNTPDLLFSSMAHDLCRFHPAAADAINNVLESNRNILSQSLTRQFEKLFLLPITSIPSSEPVVVVIDAFDEGLYEGLHDRSSELREKFDEAIRVRKELLDIFGRECSKLPPNCCIIITSRPEPAITQLGRNSHVCVKEIDLGDPQNLSDIERFAIHSLRGIAEERCLEATWPGKELSEAYIRKAEGLYLWVSTTTGFIVRATNPLKQLQQLCGDGSSLNLGPEAKMAQLYSTVLAACPWDDVDFADNYQLLMGTILTLKTPLSPLAIKSLLGVELAVVDTLRSLGPVLTGVTDTGRGERPLQIIHDSFRAYSTTRGPFALSHEERRYAIDMEEHNHQLAIAVLHTLNRDLPLVESTVGEITASIMGPEGNIPSPPVGSISESLWYCCQYLIAHLNQVTVPSIELVEALREFSNAGLALWAVLCASKGEFQDISAILAKCNASLLELPSSNVEAIAGLLRNLDGDLRYMARLEEAALAIRGGVDLYRQLSDAQPTEFTPELAMCLHIQSVGLSNLGRHEEALAASHEALVLYRQLAKDQPAGYTRELATSLQGASVHESNLGHHEKALAIISEAVDLGRQLAKDQPYLYNSTLAYSLHTQSFQLSELGRHTEALAVMHETLDVRRQLADEAPEAHASELADSVQCLSVILSELDCYEEALAACQEALDLYRQLVKTRPSVFTPNLANSLRSISFDLSKVGRHEEALAAAQEALELYRPLVKSRPGVFDVELADSLEQLVECLKCVHRTDEAAQVREEWRLLKAMLRSNGT